MGFFNDISLVTIMDYAIGLVILAIAAILVVRHMKSKEGKEKLKQFLKEVEDIVRAEIVGAIMKIDFKDMINNAGSIQDAEINLINSLYEKIWGLLIKHLDEMYGEDPLYIIMKQNLTPEFITDFCEMIIQSKSVQQLINKDVEEAAMLSLSESDDLEEEYTKINEAIENGTYEEGYRINDPVDEERPFPNPVEIKPPSEDGDNDWSDGEVVGEATEIDGGNLMEGINKEE